MFGIDISRGLGQSKGRKRGEEGMKIIQASILIPSWSWEVGRLRVLNRLAGEDGSRE